MKLVETFIEEIKSLLLEKGEDLANYQFIPLSDTKIKVSKSGADHIIDLNKEVDRLIELSDYTTTATMTTTDTMNVMIDASTDEIDGVLTDSTDPMTDDAVSETTSDLSSDTDIYSLNQCVKNCISLMDDQIEQNSHGVDFELEMDYYITCSSSSHPVSLDNLHFDEHDVKSTSGHNLRGYTIRSGNPGLDLLIIPGYLSSHIIYTNILTDQNILNEHNVYIFDPRGQGASDSPNPERGLYGSKSQNADDVDSIITALGIKNVVLIGHSFGWLRIGDYISKYGQDNIKGLVCIDGFPEIGTKLATRLINATYLNYLMTFINRTSLCHTDKINEFADIVSFSFINSPGSMFKTLFSTDIWSVRKDIRLPILAHEPVDYLDTLWPTVTVPTLIQWGEHDNVLSIQAAKEIYKTLPKSILKIYGAKHYPFIDDQTKFMNDLYRFIDTLDGSV